MADRQTVAHVLRRATFGPTAAEIDAGATAGVEATVERLLAPPGPDPGAAATPIPTLGPDPYGGGRNLTREQKQQAQDARREQVQVLLRWWLERMVAADHQLAEKMIFFWHGHWATSIQKVKSAPLMLRQLETFRGHGTGDFLDLTRAMLRDPALIFWLDGQRNTRQAPNENLARELMELFTVGIGAYTEDDIKMGARALTGWTIDRETGATRLVPRRHDEGPKTILGVTQNFDADSYAALLVAQPDHPSFLAARLWLRFGSVSPLPDATRQRLVAAYGTGRDVRAMMRALLLDEGFAATRGQLVKQPVEWAVGALRQLGIAAGSLAAAKARQLLGPLDGLGQVPLRPPSVGGWPSGTAWLTTSSAQARLRLAAALAGMAPAPVIGSLEGGPVATRLDRLAAILAVDAWTDRTKAALTTVGGDPRRLLGVALVSPEYTVS